MSKKTAEITIMFTAEIPDGADVKQIMNHRAVRNLDLERDFKPHVNGVPVDGNEVPNNGGIIQFKLSDSRGPIVIGP